MRVISFFVFLLASLTAFGAGGGAGTPESTVQHFYATLAKPQPDLRRQLKGLAPFLGANLNALVQRALAADEAYHKKFPDDVPPFEHGTCVFYGGGDCAFSSYRLVKTDRGDALAKTTVELSLADRNRPSQPPYRWPNMVTLKMVGGRWVIDEIEYLDGKASDTLKAIIQDAQAPGNE